MRGHVSAPEKSDLDPRTAEAPPTKLQPLLVHRLHFLSNYLLLSSYKVTLRYLVKA